MIYTYKCKKCENKFVINPLYNSYNPSQRRKCPKCKSFNTVRTFIDAPSVVFKGEGFTKSSKGSEFDGMK